MVLLQSGVETKNLVVVNSGINLNCLSDFQCKTNCFNQMSIACSVFLASYMLISGNCSHEHYSLNSDQVALKVMTSTLLNQSRQTPKVNLYVKLVSAF